MALSSSCSTSSSWARPSRIARRLGGRGRRGRRPLSRPEPAVPDGFLAQLRGPIRRRGSGRVGAPVLARCSPRTATARALAGLPRGGGLLGAAFCSSLGPLLRGRGPLVLLCATAPGAIRGRGSYGGPRSGALPVLLCERAERLGLRLHPGARRLRRAPLRRSTRFPASPARRGDLLPDSGGLSPGHPWCRRSGRARVAMLVIPAALVGFLAVRRRAITAALRERGASVDLLTAARGGCCLGLFWAVASGRVYWPAVSAAIVPPPPPPLGHRVLAVARCGRRPCWHWERSWRSTWPARCRACGTAERSPSTTRASSARCERRASARVRGLLAFCAGHHVHRGGDRALARLGPTPAYESTRHARRGSGTPRPYVLVPRTTRGIRNDLRVSASRSSSISSRCPCSTRCHGGFRSRRSPFSCPPTPPTSRRSRRPRIAVTTTEYGLAAPGVANPGFGAHFHPWAVWHASALACCVSGRRCHEAACHP